MGHKRSVPHGYRRHLGSGPKAAAIVDIIGNSSTDLMTKDDASLLEAKIRVEVASVRADVYRALWMQGAGIVAAVGTFIAISTVILG